MALMVWGEDARVQDWLRLRGCRESGYHLHVLASQAATTLGSSCRGAAKCDGVERDLVEAVDAEKHIDFVVHKPTYSAGREA